MECEKQMQEGKLVPLDTTLALLMNAMKEANADRFLIDGFPRALDQAKAFEKLVGLPTRVLVLECPKEVMKERMLRRSFSKGRADDNIDTITQRFETYERLSVPVADYYESLNPDLVIKVSSVASPDLVYNEINIQLRQIFHEKEHTQNEDEHHDVEEKLLPSVEKQGDRAEQVD